MPETFDQAELLDRVDDDMEFLVETIEMLEDDGATLLRRIRNAAASGDAAAVGSHAHALKGMISNFCAVDAQAAALEVETIGKSGDLSGAPAAIDTLDERLGALVAELRTFAEERA